MTLPLFILAYFPHRYIKEPNRRTVTISLPLNNCQRQRRARISISARARSPPWWAGHQTSTRTNHTKMLTTSTPTTKSPETISAASKRKCATHYRILCSTGGTTRLTALICTKMVERETDTALTSLIWAWALHKLRWVTAIWTPRTETTTLRPRQPWAVRTSRSKTPSTK